MTNIPINNLYLTGKDFEEFNTYMDDLMTNYDSLTDKKGLKFETKAVTFVVTEDCNLCCSYCYQTNKTKRKMTKEIGKRAIDMLFDEKLVNNYWRKDEANAIILDFIGGEPLLEIELIDYIVEYFKFKAFKENSEWKCNYKISISSNGTLYDNKKVQEFINKNKGKLTINITIDGNRELHDSCRIFPDGTGSYDIAVKGLKQWLKNNENSTTKITLHPNNIKYLNNAIQNVWSLGVRAAFTNCVFENVWEFEHAKILYKEMIKLADYLLEDENYSKYYCSLFEENLGKPLTKLENWCGGNGNMLAIGPDGKCYPCIRFMNYCLSTSGRKEQPIGDVFRGLDSKNNNPWLLKLCSIDMVTQCHHEDNKKCLDCKVAEGCSLCTGFNYDYFGDVNHKATFICDTHKARVLANYYYWNKLYKKLNLNYKFELNLDKEFIEKINL